MNHELLDNSKLSATPWDSLTQIDPSELAIAKMRKKVLNLSEATKGGLMQKFPSGNYLYHGAQNGDIAKIIESGFLGNAMAVAGQRGKNSGYEGISWSMDGIDALPGTNGHLAGFLAAPEDVLDADTKLAIPSRPAPYEMLQISDKLKTVDFFDDRIQFEMWGDTGFLGEKNSVINNLSYIYVWRKSKNNSSFSMDKPMLFDFLDKQWQASDLQKLYYYSEDGSTKLSKELFQQWKIPVGAVWIQRIVDSNWMREAADGKYGDMGGWQKIIAENNYASLDTRGMIKLMQQGDEKLRSLLQNLASGIAQKYDKALEQESKNITPIKIPLEQMFFITNQNDLDEWLQKFAESGHEPKGFLLYDANKIQKSNFASTEQGDHQELTREINYAIGNLSNFWQEQMGMDIGTMERSGSVGQVLKESALKRDRVVKLTGGRLSIVDES